jgi:hypothetical protein
MGLNPEVRRSLVTLPKVETFCPSSLKNYYMTIIHHDYYSFEKLVVTSLKKHTTWKLRK